MNGDFRRAIVWGPLRRKSRAAPHVFVVLSLVLSTSALLGFSSVSSASEVVAQINFQPKDSVVPFGYRSDYGEAFDSKRGYGWIDQNKNKPASIVGNGRERNLDGDQRRDTLMYMQYKGSEPGSVAKSARWQYAIASGTYDVRVTVGDPLLTENSVHRVVVEGVVAIPSFTPTSDNRFAMGSVRVQVSDGRLTLNAAGGVNTKINYVDIVKASTDSAPHVVDVDPASGAPNAPVTTSVTLSLSEAVDTATISSSTVKLLDPQGTQVAGSYNSDAVGSLISFTPTVRLLAQTTYTVRTTSGLIAASGQAFTPFSSAFTTGSGGVPPAPLEYDRLTVGDLTGPTTLTFGPDGKLYVATGIGQILRYTLGSNGLPVGPPETFDRWTNQRTITGLRFDPAASATNLKLWVSHGALGFEDMPNFTGKISVLSGATLQNARDVIVGLPRSTRDHLNNGIDFGPDGRLYLAQGSTTGYGAPDNFWGLRNEVPLSAAVLVANVNGDSRFQGTVDVDTSAGYDPNAAGAPVTVHASGTRNPFDLVWQTSGSLYAPVNESAGGNTPAGPTGTPPALYDLPAGRDFLARIRAGRYYGHPNPSRGQYVLNGGNPTSAVDPFEV
ncbi:MAG TPA: Ig-like domain-containing protein, partial [Acidimicrobiales bacterium]